MDTLHSWVQVGGFPSHPEKEAWGLLLEVSLFSSPSFWSLCSFLLLFQFLPMYFSSLGLDLMSLNLQTKQWRLPLQLLLQLQRKPSPPICNPFTFSWRGINWVYQCWVEGCKEGPSTSHATICAHVCKVHLGVGLVHPSCSKSFFNPDTFWHHKKKHFNQ